MENVPWHADVKAFSEALSQRSKGEYEVACEHVHSCCVLLAKVDKFKINGQWCTWIDYEKFHDLVGYLAHFSFSKNLGSSYNNVCVCVYTCVCCFVLFKILILLIEHSGGFWKTF